MAKSYQCESQVCPSYDSVEFKKVGSNVVNFESKAKNKSSDTNNKTKAAFEKILEEANELTW